MKKITVFSVNTIFHLMLTKFFIKKENIEKAYILCNSINSTIPKIIEEDAFFVNHLILDRNEKTNNNIQLALKNRKQIVKTKKFFKSIVAEQLIVFKDHDIINQSLIDLAKNRNIKVILIEEGLGLYKESYDRKMVMKQPLLKTFFLSYPKFIFKVLGINPKVDEIYASSPSYLPAKKSNNKIVNDLSLENLSNNDIESLYDYFNLNESAYDNVSDNEKINILYIGQPLSEFRSLSHEKEKKGLESIFKQLIKAKNLNIIIKPHPSENISKYSSYLAEDCVMLFNDHHIPAELIPSKININLVLTGYSSACFYIKKWYGIETYSFYNILFESLAKKPIEDKIKNMYEIEILKNSLELDQTISRHIKSIQKRTY